MIPPDPCESGSGRLDQMEGPYGNDLWNRIDGGVVQLLQQQKILVQPVQYVEKQASRMSNSIRLKQDVE